MTIKITGQSRNKNYSSYILRISGQNGPIFWMTLRPLSTTSLQFKLNLKNILLCIVLMLSASIPNISPVGQSALIMLTVSLPEFYNTFIDDHFFEPFEAEHPNVRVMITHPSNDIYPLAAGDLDKYLNSVRDLVQSADVLYVSGNEVSNIATRAAYYLDMESLVENDQTLNQPDFYPALWNSFRWDGGFWALPLSGSINLLLYDPKAFDQAGIAYPDGNWTLNDFAQAATKLAHSTQQDGAPSFYSPLVTNVALLIRSVLKTGFYDDSQVPNPPHINTSDVQNALDTLANLQRQGLIAFSGRSDLLNQASITIGPASNLYLGQSKLTGGSLLPGGAAGISPTGFAISAGTLYPDLAYDLAKFITSNPKLAYIPGADFPARRSMNDVQSNLGTLNKIPDELRPLMNQAIDNAVPLAELRYSNYLFNAFSKMIKDNVDSYTALQESETEAVATLQNIAQYKTKITVATAVPLQSIPADKIQLKFGVSMLRSPLPNRADWEHLVAQFISGDPQVGGISLDTSSVNEQDFANRFDCFYLSYNAVQNINPNTILDLTPLIDADSGFDRNDVLGNTLLQVEKSNRILAFPIVLHPVVLWYDANAFKNANIPTPDLGWSISDFNDALLTLQRATNTGGTSLDLGTISNTALLMMIASNGGLPLDYRTNPPALNLTDAKTVSATETVLDLVKKQVIADQQLTSLYKNTISPMSSPIYASILDELDYQSTSTTNNDPLGHSYRPALFPTGTDFDPASYTIGTAYISANTPYPDACYRWIEELSHHTYLLSGMSARSSLLKDPTTIATQGADLTQLYDDFANSLKDPKTIIFPARSDILAEALPEQTWLNRAFDNYVINKGDLSQDLKDTEQLINTYRVCVSALPSFDPTLESAANFAQLVNNCAKTSDPTFGS